MKEIFQSRPRKISSNSGLYSLFLVVSSFNISKIPRLFYHYFQYGLQYSHIRVVENNKFMLKENIEQVNQDLRIRLNYLQPNLSDGLQYSSSTSSPYRLMQALKKRNKLYTQKYDPQLLPEVPQPIRHLTYNATKNLKMTEFRQQKIEKRQELARQWGNQLQWQRFTFLNQEQYVDVHQQYLIQSLVNRSFEQANKMDKSIKNVLLNKLKGTSDTKQQSRIISNKSKVRIQKEVETNKEKYLDFVKRKVLANEEKMTGFDEFQHLAGHASNLWHIICEQFKSYKYAVSQQKDNPKLALPLCSIAHLESKFRHELPSTENQKQISQFIRKRCLQTSSTRNINNFESTQEGILTWSVPYALYRAGLHTHTSIALSQRGKAGNQLKQEIRKFQESLAQFQPTPQDFGEGLIDDAFYHQLVSIVKGISQYDERLCKIGGYDFIWLTLKSISIYQDTKQSKKQQLQQVTEALTHHFLLNKDATPKQDPLLAYQQLLYLSDFKNFATLYQKSQKPSILPIQDFIHICLALLSNNEILTLAQRDSLTEALSKQLITFLTFLLTGSQKQYAIFYVLQIPVQYFEDAVLKVFHSWKLFNQVNNSYVDGLKGWEFVKFRFQYGLVENVFQSALSGLLLSLLKIQKQSETRMKIIKSAQQLITKPQNFLNLILQCQCSLLLKTLTTSQQKPIHKLNHLLSDTLQQHRQDNPELVRQFEPIILFIENYSKLIALSRQKNNAKLEQFVRNQSYLRDLALLFIDAQEQDNFMTTLWKKLEEFSALELFFKYAVIVVQTVQKIWSIKGAFEKVESFKQAVNASLAKIRKQRIYNIDKYADYIKF